MITVVPIEDASRSITQCEIKGIEVIGPVDHDERGNIVLRILDGVLPLFLVRVIDLINAILIFIVLAGMAIQFWLYRLKTMKAGEITWLLNIPKAPFWFAMDGVLWVSVAVQLVLLAQAVTSLRNAQS